MRLRLTSALHVAFLGLLIGLPQPTLAQTNYVANTASGSSAASYNTLVGVQAGININTSGQANVFTGYQAGYANTSGTNNVFVGLGTGYNNTAGSQNVAVGHQAGVGSGATNTNNVSIGFQAGVGSGGITDAVNIGYLAGRSSNVSGNVFIGSKSGTMNSSGYENTFLGYYSGSANTAGVSNTFLGYQAGQSNTIGFSNTFVGDQAGYSTNQGTGNTFIGAYAGKSNLSDYGTFLGTSAGISNTTGAYNTFLGFLAGRNNTTGASNTFVGNQVGINNSTGGNNTFIGYLAGQNVTTGSNNIIIGPSSGTAITNGNDNVLMGYNSQADEGILNGIAIGANSRVASSNSLILGNGVNVGIGTSAPKSKLEVVADEDNASGLRLTQLTSQSKPTQATDQFLTVNEKGDVVKARYQLRINTTAEWSDKVFSPTYPLRPLPTVASYIGQHGHLPGVPSADQVVKEGVDLVKMNALLLEKVEELTLYSIELEKTNQHQEARIDQLEKQHKQEIADLKKLVNELLKKQ